MSKVTLRDRIKYDQPRKYETSFLLSMWGFDWVVVKEKISWEEFEFNRSDVSDAIVDKIEERFKN